MSPQLLEASRPRDRLFRARRMLAAIILAPLACGGVVDFLEVLDSERTRFSVELEESFALQQSLNAIVQLYKALGGGWRERQPTP